MAAADATHGQIVTLAGGTAAGNTTIGSITLPAGGPWLIHDVHVQAAAATATAGEALIGTIEIDAASGDLTPSPAPALFPCLGSASFLGAVADVSSCPLSLFPVAWSAPGKATLNLIWNNPTTMTVAPIIQAGIMYGKTRPVVTPMPFCDRVRAAVTSAADTSVGTITLAEKAKRIVAICGILTQDGVLTTAEELIGFLRLASDDIELVPAQFPFNQVYSAGLGATIFNGAPSPIRFIPVDIPVPGGARIDCFVDLFTAVTNACEVQIFIGYE